MRSNDDDLARIARAELLLDYIGKKVREQTARKEAEKEV